MAGWVPALCVCGLLLLAPTARADVLNPQPPVPAPVPVPTVVSTDPSSPGASKSPLVSGTAVPLAGVRVYTDAACLTPVATVTADGSGAWSVPVTVARDASTALYARTVTVDLFGAEVGSDCSQPLRYVEDSTPPGEPTFSSLDAASPSRLDSVRVAGQAEPGGMVRLYTNSGCTGSVAGAGPADTAGAWAVTVAVAHDATTSFYAAETDAAGNASGCASGPVFVQDLTAPAAPRFSGSVPASPSPSATPRLTGAAEPGSTVSLYTDAVCSSGALATGSAEAFASGGIAVAAVRGATTYVYAVATDAAGNRSPCAGSLAYTQAEEAHPTEAPVPGAAASLATPDPPMPPQPLIPVPAAPAPVQPDPQPPAPNPGGARGHRPVARTVTLSNERTVTRWAHPSGQAIVRRSPRPNSRAITRLHRWNEDGAPEVYVALRLRTDDTGRTWVQVRLPMRPNGTSGWVRRAALGGLHLIHTQLQVSKRTLRATLYRSGRRVWSARVGVGKRSTPTPSGSFWIRDVLRPANPGTIYGPLAFGTSAYSVLTDWPGGGVVGIHGTNEPALIPGRPSHGCVRVRNDAIRRLGRLMPLGTPVLIR